MIPVLFNIGPLSINSFGLMMVCAFLAGWRCLYICLKEQGEDPLLAERMVLWAAVAGIIGARLNFLIEYPREVAADPLGMIFGGAGFVFYGGFLGGLLGAIWLLRRAGKPFFRYADIASPTLAIGYAIGRIGCHLSGDGDYGIPTNLPWAVSYRLGVVPTPPGVLVHPTPIYETIVAFVITALLLHLLRKRTFSHPGQLFGLYLILTAVSRFLVEFIRIEPIIAFDLTQAQLAAIVLVVVGLVLVAAPRGQASS